MFEVEKSHYLHLLLAYFYSIGAGANQFGKPNIDQCMLSLKDRLQTGIQELDWVGMYLSPNHINVLDHGVVAGFMAFGAVPLSLNEDYNTTGKPAEGVNNKFFMAK